MSEEGGWRSVDLKVDTYESSPYESSPYESTSTNRRRSPLPVATVESPLPIATVESRLLIALRIAVVVVIRISIGRRVIDSSTGILMGTSRGPIARPSGGYASSGCQREAAMYRSGPRASL